MIYEVSHHEIKFGARQELNTLFEEDLFDSGPFVDFDHFWDNEKGLTFKTLHRQDCSCTPV